MKRLFLAFRSEQFMSSQLYGDKWKDRKAKTAQNWKNPEEEERKRVNKWDSGQKSQHGVWECRGWFLPDSSVDGYLYFGTF